MGSKKSSQELNRKHAEQKRQRDRERAAAGYKPHKGISMGSSKKQDNSLSNPIAQALAGLIRLNRAKQMSRARDKREYKPRKV